MLFTKHKKPRWLKRAAAGVTAVMLGAGVIVGGAAPALAADLYQPAGTVPGLDVGPRDATGALDLRAGGVQLAAVNQARTEYCVNLNALTSGADVVSVTDLPAPVPRVPGLEATSAQMAWIISHFKGGTDWDVAAIALLVHANYEAEPSPGTGYYAAGTKPGSPAEAAGIVINAVRSWAPGLETRAREMIAQAKASGIAGYTGGIPTGENHRHGAMSAPTIKNSSGQVLTNVPVVLTLVGPATWDENNGKTLMVKPNTTHKWSATANGTVRADYWFKDPSGKLSKVLRSTTQDSIRWDPEGEVTRGTTEAFEVVYDFQPRGVSNAVKLVDGGAFTDTLTAAADPNYGSGEWLTKEQVGSGTAGFVPVTYVARAYQVGTLELPATGDTVPKNARLVDTKTVVAAGPGDIEASFDVTEPGWYTVVWSVSKTGQGSNATYIHGDWADKYGMPEETVSKRYEAKIDSALSIRETKSGPYLVDDVFVTGLPKDHPNFKGGMRFSADAQEITHRVMFFPAGVEAADENLGQAVQVGDTVTIPAKNGFYPSVGDTSWIAKTDKDGRLVPGTYVFISEFAGDDRVKPLKTSAADKTEQFVVPGKPGLHTTLMYEGKKDPVPAEGFKTLVDKVTYTNVKPGKTYEVVGKLMDKATGEPLKDKNGKPITSTVKVTPKSANGSVDVAFKVPAYLYGSVTTVAFEEMRQGGNQIAVHADINDENQTIEFTPKLVTTATDTQDGDKSLKPGKDASITDKVCSPDKDLIPGKEYEITTTLFTADGTPVKGADGKQVKVVTKFTPKSADECAVVEIKFDGSGMAGEKVVVFEDVYENGKLFGVHHDLNDQAQTVQFEKPLPNLPHTGAVDTALAATLAALLLGAGVGLRRTVRKWRA